MSQSRFFGPSSGAPSLIELLRRDNSADGFMPTAERILHIQQDLGRILPAGFREGCAVAQLSDGVLTLAVSSSALASKLRQTLPRLRDGLEHHGWKVNSIQLRLQPRNNVEESMSYKSKEKTARIPESALPHMEELARSVTHPELRTALENLLKHHRPPKRTA